MRWYCIHPLKTSLYMLEYERVTRRELRLLRALVILANSTTLTDMARILKFPAADLGQLLLFLEDAHILRRWIAPEQRHLHALAGAHATGNYGSKLAGRQTRKLQPEVSYGRYADTRAAAWVR